ncbi:MAG: hypothetical protein AMXMBFR53_40640 [Gemmatimonadota bacterium]
MSMDSRRLQALSRSVPLVLLALCATSLAGQDVPPPPPGRESALRVFLDCATWRCREDRFRQDIDWVTWVREPQDAQVYILLTGQQAGGGGFQYAFDFEGRGPMAQLTDRYLFTSSATDVEEEVVGGLSRTLAAGLVRFAARAGFLDVVRITGAQRPGPPPGQPAGPREDPWNYWVFSLRGNMELDREDQETQDEFSFGASANRTTDAWKVDLGGNLNVFRREVTYEDGDVYQDERDDWGARLLVVRSLSPHWSVGFTSSAGSSTRFNESFAIGFSPAVEWNYFPWQESTRRRLVGLYTLGYEFLDYDEVTVYEKLEESLVQHRLDLQFRMQEPWGNLSLNAEARQYLQFTDQYSLQFGGNVDYRLVRGLGVNLELNYEVIHDQRYLSGEGLTPEEILTSRRALATGSRFSVDVGLSYRFGSIFNNIVNARFPALGGGGGGRGG